jgi:poly-gamma-glutamate synthesis protein (capsule biosynthesis protein)
MNILVFGDLCPAGRVAKLFDEQKYADVLGAVPAITGNADYSIVNFEAPIVESGAKSIAKCGPNLRTNENAIDALRYAGFDCVTLANNHFRDYGNQGCSTTIRYIEKAELDYVGGGNSIEQASRTLYKRFGQETLAIVNICENEFSIATDEHGGAAPLDVVANYYQIKEARSVADYVLVIVHGGHEHYQLPSPRMKRLYRFFIEIGADAVVNHHQHCYSGYEIYNSKPIFYGLGNFCFDSDNHRNDIWNEGYGVCISFSQDRVLFELHPYTQCSETPDVEFWPRSSEKYNSFIKNIGGLNEIIADDTKLQSAFKELASSRKQATLSLYASHHNRYLNALSHRGWFPRFIKKHELLQILNHTNCEAHRDIVIANLFSEIK